MSATNYKELLEKAVISIKDGKSKIKQFENEKNEPIAIIGASCRLPGKVSDLYSLQTLLENKTDAISDIPKNRWDFDKYYSNKKEKGKIYASRGGIIENIEGFDASFFKISPAEAKMMDPQHRVLLELAWETLENSNILPEKLYDQLTGVFIGISSVDYLSQISKNVHEKEFNGYLASGNTSSTASGRISYHLGLKGPCMVMDTACSSSLTAIHQACNSLRKKECDLALTGGVNLLISPLSMLAFSQAGMLSPDNKCHTFSNDANGYVRSEGAGLIALKRLSDAIRDGDNILGKIIGSAINHNGPSGGLTVPNGTSQKELIQKTIQNAELTPDQIDYIEAHGTGTPLGDPIEINALHKVFSDSKTKENPLLVGSIKTNIGHLEAAAGIAGVLKMIVQLQNQKIYPHLHFDTPSSHIKWNNIKINIPTKNIPWEFNKTRRIGGVSSFGVNGSNAHVIIEEYIPAKVDKVSNQGTLPIIFILSAKNKNRLIAYSQVMLEYLDQVNKDKDLVSLAYTLQTSRQPMEERLAIVADSIADLKEKLKNSIQDSQVSDTTYSGNIKENPSPISLKGKAGEMFIKNAIEYKEYGTIAELWVNGISIHWELLYTNQKPKKAILPTYPFGKEKYWIPLQSKIESTALTNIHPLLHQNESNLSEQKFISVFDGNELFFRDHKVFDKKVLPGVAYLELIKKAGELSLSKKISRIKNVFFIAPLEINKTPEKIETCIFYSKQELCFQVFLVEEDGNKELAQGNLEILPPDNPEKKNITKIKAELETSKDKEECYDFFKSLGFSYGKSFQGIEKIYFRNDEALSRIHLPREKEYILQPGILDAALQTCLAFKFLSEDKSLEIPYHIKEVNIYAELPSKVWCYVLKTKTQETSLTTFDICILDESGNVLLKFESFSGLTHAHASTRNIEVSVENDHCVEIDEENSTNIKKGFVQYTISLLSEELDQPKEDFKLDVPLEEYGIDSIAIHGIAEQLEIHFKNIPSTILFEYQTINELYGYFVENHLPELKKLIVDDVINENRILATGNKEKPVATKNIRPKEFLKTSKEPTTNKAISDIVIVGVGGVFPESLHPDQLWSNVMSEDGLKRTSLETISNYGYGKVDLQQNNKFIDVLGISTEKFNSLSYQLKMMTHVIGQAFANYEISLDQMSRKKTGVFIAAQQMFPGKEDKNRDQDGQIQLSYLIPNTISFLLNLSGPSELVNTYCTSVYVALHKAIQSIENGECDQAIVGGVNSIMAEDFAREGFDNFKTLLSPKNETRSFSQNGTGFIRSEGAGVILIKKLDIAKSDGNTILARIKGSSVAHSGKSFSLEAPSAKGIKEVIHNCAAKAGIDASTIDYIEAHGIANPVSDAIELRAINQAYTEFCKSVDKKWVIGSVKPTVGHPELASGAASLIKVIKALENKIIPGIQKFDTLNSEMTSSHSLLFRSNATKWKNGTYPRRAALNSYAVGGVNAHIILEEYIENNEFKEILSTREIETISKTIAQQHHVQNSSVLDQLFPRGTQEEKKVITSLVQELLEIAIDDLNNDISLYDFDSIKLMQLVRVVNDTFKIELGMGEILSVDNFGEFFDLLERTLSKKKDNASNDVQNLTVINTDYPLSEGQKGLFFIQMLEPESTAYNIPIAITIHQRISKEDFQEVLLLMQEEYPILRANFINDEKEGRLFQKISTPGKEILLSYKKNTKPQELLQEFKELLRKPFKLHKDSLIRADVRYTEAQTHILFTIHHIIFDGFSTVIFMNSLMEKLKEILSNIKITIAKSELGYFDFINKEQSYLLTEQGEKSLAYWKEKLKGKSLFINLHYDKKSNLGDRHKRIVNYEEISIDKIKLQEIRKLASSFHVNLSTFILGIFQILLNRLSGDKEIPISTPVIGRPQKQHEQSIGYFVNMMIVHSSLVASKTFKELVTELRKEISSGLDHATYPFSKLVSLLGLNESKEHSKIFNVSYNFQSFFSVFSENINANDHTSYFQIWEDMYQEVEDDYGIEVYDLKEELRIGIKYQDHHYEKSTIKRHLNYFKELLDSILEAPDKEIGLYDILPEAEKHQLLYSFNTTLEKVTEEKTVIDLFEEQVLKTPKKVAVFHDGTSVSYEELDKRANQLAHLLVDKGVKQEDLIGIYMGRSLEMIVGILGVLKSGAAYVPLWPYHPIERTRQIIANTELHILITDHLNDAAIPFIDGLEKVTINKEFSLLSEYSTSTPEVSISLSSASYVIHTSGTTGVPKGVVIEHGSIANRLVTEVSLLELNEDLISCLTTNYIFDVSLLEIFLPLIVGGKLVVPKDENLKEMSSLISLLSKEKITLLQGTPSFFTGLVELLNISSNKLLNVSRICVGGESLNGHLVNTLKAKLPWVKINNHYGPTEATIDSIVLENVDSFDRNILGKPLKNTNIYILGDKQELLPLGVVGELYIGGGGIARGYLNDLILTKEKFPKNPFIENECMYRSGDFARWLPDGTIEFLGRKDAQIKLRGHRIELREIEANIEEIEHVERAVVTLKEYGDKRKMLVAFIVSTSNDNTTDIAIRLKKVLPEYMIPKRYITIASIPMTVNGKIDYSALPEVDTNAIENNDFVAPSTKNERILAQSWEKVLGLKKVGIQDDFFDVGGDSILAIKLLSEIKKTFNRELSVKSIFSYPTVYDFSRFLEDIDSNVSYLDSEINVENESSLDIDLSDLTVLESYKEIPENIFLTGATGFVGVYLLSNLLIRTTATIYCMVRGATLIEAKDRIIDKLKKYELYHPDYLDRIIPVLGDLSKENLGIHKQMFKEITKKVDYIYHTASYMNHFSNYDQLKKANVNGNREILKIATSVKLKKVLYTSTVDGLVEGAKEKDSRDHEIHKISSGYGGSKWVGEKIMSKAQEKGIPLQIYRLGLITGDSITGKIPENQWFSWLLKSCYELGYFAEEMTFPITPVDYVSQAITSISLHQNITSDIFHLSNSQFVNLEKFFNNPVAKLDEIKKISLQNWLSKLEIRKNEIEILPILKFIDFETDEIKNIMKGASSFKRFDIPSSKYTEEILEREMNLKFPDLEVYCDTYLKSIVEK